MTRRQSLGPLDPIYRVKTQYGSVAVGNTPPSVTSPSVTIDQAAGQSDPTAVSPILFTAVFSRAVTGFTTGDVTLTGTAGAAVGAVTDSGDHITYTVSVSGMTASGTVIATIAAGVCTAISDGQPNLASTSTDNTVTYGDPLGLLYAAIEYFSPLSHWPLRETTGTTHFDVRPLANNSTTAAGASFGGLTAPDGFPAPLLAGVTNAGGSANDDDGYTPSFASGLTVVCAVRPDLTGGFPGVCVSKRSDGGTNPEWEIGYGATGAAYGLTWTSAAGVARQITTATGVLTDDVWALLIVRFSGSTTGFPSIRINGASLGSTSGTGTANGNTVARLQLARRNSGSTAMLGGLSNVAIYAGQLTDPQCAVIEAAADAEGWY